MRILFYISSTLLSILALALPVRCFDTDPSVCVCSFFERSLRFRLVTPTPFCSSNYIQLYGGRNSHKSFISGCNMQTGVQTLQLRGGGDSISSSSQDEASRGNRPVSPHAHLHVHNFTTAGGVCSAVEDAGNQTTASVPPVQPSSIDLGSAATTVARPRRIIWQRPSQSDAADQVGAPSTQIRRGARL